MYKSAISLFSILILLTLTTAAQSIGPKCAPVDKPDWELDGLRGRVKSVRTYKAWFYGGKNGLKAERKRELEEEVSYDPKGNQTKWRNVNYLPADPKDRFTAGYTCDAHNRISEARYTRANGSLAKRITYVYDERGREKERADYSPDGTLERKETYTYDDKGNLIEEVDKQQVHPEHYVPKRYDVYVTTKVTLKYDDKGNKVEEKHFYPDGSLYASWVYGYDLNNRMIKSTRFDKEGRPEDQVTYKYDDAGKLIEEVNYANFCYHRDGRMCEGSVNSGDGVFYYATKVIYEYDPQGNWIKQSEFSMGGEKKQSAYEPETVLYREISYY